MSTSRQFWRPLLLSAAIVATAAVPVQAQGKVTSPKEFFGHNIGDDYFLPTYDQFTAYWRKISAESPRAKLLEIGKTEEGRPHLAMIVTSPENQAKLARYKEISKKLHDAKGVDSTMARALAKEGKAVVWIDGGLHATEVVGANQLIETNYQLLSRNDEETRRILNDVIVIMVHANPDGMQMVAKQYMSNPDTLARRVGSPRLYNKYAGHDDNRDLYMSNLRESQNMNKLMYWEWDPQIMYNHHQSGPAGTVIFSPPFRDPFNYNFDPMIVMGLDMVGAAMHQRFLQEGKPGFTMRSGSSYSTWWNGGLRTTAYFQNIVGILTEIIGNPTPEQIPPIVNQMLPRGDLPAPIEPQPWHFRQSIDYSVTANYSILDLASRYKDQWLYNIWKMGSNQIERGSRDHWTISNEDIARMDSAARGGTTAGRGGRGGADVPAGDAGVPPGQNGGGRGSARVSMEQYNAVMKDPARRDPRAFIISSAQPDFATATKFINALRYIGVEVNRTTAPLTVAGKSYPVGSFVVNTAQAGRAHVMDMFTPQDHPNDFAYPGAPPTRPYDNAGWTLAYQMGVQFDAVQETVKGPLALIEGLAKPLPGKVTAPPAGGGYLLTPAQNDAFTVVNRALKAGGEVWRTASQTMAGGHTYPAGSFFVVANPTTTGIVNTAAADLGVDADGATRPAGGFQLKQPKIALWEPPNGSMPSGWTRLVFERFEFPYEVVCGGSLDAADVRSKFDIIVLPDNATGALPGGGGGRGGRGGGAGAPAGGRGGAGGAGARTPSNDPDLAPACVPGSGGNPSANTYRKFLESGGVVVANGSSSEIGTALGLPIKDFLVEKAPGEPEKHLSGQDFYVPGSILSAAVDAKSIATAGLPDHIDIFFSNDPVYLLGPDAASKGLKPVMWFDTDQPLRSGWAWGQNYLEGGTVGVEAMVGSGKLFMFSPDITFRGQPHTTFKFLFNSIYSK